jgi:bifunctional DNA-binding transcriptional regulator/antitoxin component of YhaV-PrlF toxin-antitoxin module
MPLGGRGGVMKVLNQVPDQDALIGGFGTVDEKGRISLSKPVRGALGVQAGSSVAYIVLDGALLVVPQDEHLATLMDRAALAAAGMSAQDLLDELPAARAEVVTEAYGAEFVRELERLRSQTSAE